MNKEQIIYSLSVEDVFTVKRDNDLRLKIEREDISFIEEKVGDIIDWRGAIAFALAELKERKKSLRKK